MILFPQEKLSCSAVLLESLGLVLKAFLFSLENWSQCPRLCHTCLIPNDRIRLRRLKPLCTISFVSPSLSVIFFCFVLFWQFLVSFVYQRFPLPQPRFLLLEAWQDWKLEEKPQLNSLALTLTVISNHRLILLLDLTNGSQSAQLSSLENIWASESQRGK